MLYGSFFLWYTILVFFHVYTIAASVCPNRRVALWGGSIFIAFGQIPIGAIMHFSDNVMHAERIVKKLVVSKRD